MLAGGDTSTFQALGSDVKSELIAYPNPGKVTSMTEFFDVNGDGRADVRRTTNVSGMTVIGPADENPTLRPGQTRYADHNGDGRIDSVTETNENGEKRLLDTTGDGRFDVVIEDARRVPNFSFEGVDASQVASQILEDSNKDGFFDQISVTERRLPR